MGSTLPPGDAVDSILTGTPGTTVRFRATTGASNGLVGGIDGPGCYLVNPDTDVHIVRADAGSGVKAAVANCFPVRARSTYLIPVLEQSQNIVGIAASAAGWVYVTKLER